MTLTSRTLARSLAPLALMGVIFALSAQSNLGTDLGLIDLIGRKFVHAGVYGLLTLLWWWALGGATPSATSAHGRPALIAAAGIAFLYAASDEFHQSFVDGRVGSPIDVVIDAVGIAIACRMVASGRATRLYSRLSARLAARRSAKAE